MEEVQQEIIRELTEGLYINKDHVLNDMIEKYPALIQAVENTLCSTKAELRNFVRYGGDISGKVIADCALGLDSLDVEVVKFIIKQVNIWSGGFRCEVIMVGFLTEVQLSYLHKKKIMCKDYFSL